MYNKQKYNLKDFNNAIRKAESFGIKVVWLNDDFELCFVLHYQKLDLQITRHELYPILEN